MNDTNKNLPSTDKFVILIDDEFEGATVNSLGDLIGDLKHCLDDETLMVVKFNLGLGTSEDVTKEALELIFNDALNDTYHSDCALPVVFGMHGFEAPFDYRIDYTAHEATHA